MQLSEKETLLLNDLLGIFIELLSNRTCNDIDTSCIKDWSALEKYEFLKEYHEFNGDWEDKKGYLVIKDEIFPPDSGAVELLRHKLMLSLNTNKNYMTPFNLEKAIAGSPVISSSGNIGKYIISNKNSFDGEIHLFQFEIRSEPGGHYCLIYDNGEWKGLSNHSYPGKIYMAPEKKDMWANVYRNKEGQIWVGHVFKSREAAEESARRTDVTTLNTIKIHEYEE